FVRIPAIRRIGCAARLVEPERECRGERATLAVPGDDDVDRAARGRDGGLEKGEQIVATREARLHLCIALEQRQQVQRGIPAEDLERAGNRRQEPHAGRVCPLLAQRRRARRYVLRGEGQTLRGELGQAMRDLLTQRRDGVAFEWSEEPSLQIGREVAE